MALWFLLRCVPAAHPRSRGEHVVQQRRADNAVGSSLLARGTQLSLHQHCIHVGLIPARAGNTRKTRWWVCRPRAHPRSRGEHENWGHGFRLPFGSSPLARGTLSRSCYRMKILRLIPARAGNTHSAVRRKTTRAAHPRLCWEHGTPFSVSQAALGSSPLARGTPSRYPPRLLEPGLIPARAGSTSSPARLSASPPAHPRSRGEHV